MIKHFEPYIEFRPYSAKVSLRTPEGKEVFIEIGAGSSFGLEHRTTRLCIRGIEEVFRERKIRTVLDLGCGSGILSISAAAMGAEKIVAIDIDRVAAEEARRNVELNNMGSKIHVICGSIYDIEERFELVVANIATDDLLFMSERIKGSVEPGGVLLVSGISDLNKKKAVSRFYDMGFRLNRSFEEEGWVAIWFDYL
ncbi:MAG: hypothetical protein KatS3mg078_0465 [Deltaproteobacteria bacterium]|nr:MAG: hypothetical protein KatS3mg078_0465 [Deltaproteobacteria bacterium]